MRGRGEDEGGERRVDIPRSVTFERKTLFFCNHQPSSSSYSHGRAAKDGLPVDLRSGDLAHGLGGSIDKMLDGVDVPSCSLAPSRAYVANPLLSSVFNFFAVIALVLVLCPLTGNPC